MKHIGLLISIITICSLGLNAQVPTILSFSPASAVKGTVVTISGTNFTNATNVSFGGIAAASYTVQSSSLIKATIGSGGSGKVSVTTSNGTASLIGFKFLPASPTINSFSPSSGPVGSTVTISGTGFSTTPSNNLVYFGAVKAKVNSSTTTSLSVVVPASATFQPISVTVNGLTAYTLRQFSVTFSGALSNSTFNANTFGSKKDFIVSKNPIAIGMSDFDGDGKSDLAVISSGNNGLSILRNNSSGIGDISFMPMQNIPTLNSGNIEIVIGDLDGDGKQDIISINKLDSSLSIFRNTSTVGNVSFSNEQDFATHSLPRSVTFGDLDADGKPDLLVTYSNSSTISIYLNNSTLGNVQFATYYDITGSWGNNGGLNDIKVGDIDGDGKLDIIVPEGGGIGVFRNMTTSVGDLSFDFDITFMAGVNLRNFSLGDLNGDNKLDVVGADSYYWLTAQLNNSVVGGISFASTTYFDGFTIFPKRVSLSDLDGDGKLDLITADDSLGICIKKNTGLPSKSLFGFNTYYQTPSTSSYLAVGDLDGDGKPEIITNNDSLNFISIYRNLVGAPTITSFSPSIATAGTSVIINGTNFLPTTSVSFGGVQATSFITISSTMIVATVGLGASGNITVVTPSGTGVLGGFIYCPSTISKDTFLVGCKQVFFKGKTYTNSTIFKDTLKSMFGCDSVFRNITITIFSPVTKLLSFSGCNSVLYNGINYNTSIVKTDTIKNSNGCDSIYNNVYITINNIIPIFNSINFIACDSFIYKGVKYFTNSTIIDTFRNVNGCDSIYQTVNIIINLNKFEIAGKVCTPNNKYITNVIVGLTGSLMQNDSISNNFRFSCLDSGANYSIKVLKSNETNKTNGVTTLDVALLQSHILQKSPLNSPYKLIAADVNGDGKVSTLDIVYMKRLILGLDTTFTNTRTGEKRLWAFVDSSFKFKDSSIPFPFKDSIGFSPLIKSKINQTFIGCKLGDVNWDWNPAVAKSIKKKEDPIELYYNKILEDKNGEVRIPIKVNKFKDILGIQFTLNFNHSLFRWKGVNSNLLIMETGDIHANEGNVSFLWVDPRNESRTIEDGTVIFEIIFQKIGFNNTKNEELISLELNESITTILAYDSYNNIHGIEMIPRLIPESMNINESWTIAPNPIVNSVIHVGTMLNQRKNIVFSLINNTGKLIIQKQVELDKGKSDFILKLNDKLPLGLYFLQASGLEYEVWKKVIIL